MSTISIWNLRCYLYRVCIAVGFLVSVYTITKTPSRSVNWSDARSQGRNVARMGLIQVELSFFFWNTNNSTNQLKLFCFQIKLFRLTLWNPCFVLKMTFLTWGSHRSCVPTSLKEQLFSIMYVYVNMYVYIAAYSFLPKLHSSHATIYEKKSYNWSQQRLLFIICCYTLQFCGEKKMKRKMTFWIFEIFICYYLLHLQCITASFQVNFDDYSSVLWNQRQHSKSKINNIVWLL